MPDISGFLLLSDKTASCFGFLILYFCVFLQMFPDRFPKPSNKCWTFRHSVENLNTRCYKENYHLFFFYFLTIRSDLIHLQWNLIFLNRPKIRRLLYGFFSL